MDTETRTAAPWTTPTGFALPAETVLQVHKGQLAQLYAAEEDASRFKVARNQCSDATYTAWRLGWLAPDVPGRIEECERAEARMRRELGLPPEEPETETRRLPVAADTLALAAGQEHLAAIVSPDSTAIEPMPPAEPVGGRPLAEVLAALEAAAVQAVTLARGLDGLARVVSAQVAALRELER